MPAVEIELKDGTTAYVSFASGAGTEGDPYVVSANATTLTDIKTAVEILDNMISGSEGQVDVVTLPGTSEADITAIKTAVEILDNVVSGSEMQVDVVAALPTGSNAIGKLAANSGVDIGDVDVTTQPARDKATDNVGASLDTSAIMNDTTALTPKFAAIDAAGSGDNTIVAAVAGKKIRVLAVNFLVAAAVTVRFEDGAGGTALTGQYQFGAQGEGIVLPFNPVGWFETTANTLLNMELSGAVSVDGSFVYVEV